MPLNNPPQITLYTSGTYTGDASDNRAIPHGLRAVPKLVIVACQETAFPAFSGFVQEIRNTELYTPANVAVTSWDAVNFYVSLTTVNFNKATEVYNWVAFA